MIGRKHAAIDDGGSRGLLALDRGGDRRPRIGWPDVEPEWPISTDVRRLAAIAGGRSRQSACGPNSASIEADTHARRRSADRRSRAGQAAEDDRPEYGCRLRYAADSPRTMRHAAIPSTVPCWCGNLERAVAGGAATIPEAVKIWAATLRALLMAKFPCQILWLRVQPCHTGGHDQHQTARPLEADFAHVTDWVFDLDNTLYPHHVESLRPDRQEHDGLCRRRSWSWNRRRPASCRRNITTITARRWAG